MPTAALKLPFPTEKSDLLSEVVAGERETFIKKQSHINPREMKDANGRTFFVSSGCEGRQRMKGTGGKADPSEGSVMLKYLRACAT